MKRYLPGIIAGTILLITVVIIIAILNIPNKEKETFAHVNIENIVQNTDSGDTIIVEIEEVEDEGEPEPIDLEKIQKEATTTIDTSMYYYIEVNCTAQVVTVYKKDENNNYTIPVKAMICSTGGSTPSSGVYKMPGRRSQWRALYGGVYGHYVTNIVGAILFHSVPYLAYGDNGSLEYWEYDKLGTDASMGCVRLTVRDAKWIYENCGAGTQVEFYNDSNPGALGKPSAKKISSYPEELRNWDPTDPDENNPWHTYDENQSTKKQEEVNPTQVEPKRETTEQDSKKENTNSNTINTENTIESKPTSTTETETLVTNEFVGNSI